MVKVLFLALTIILNVVLAKIDANKISRNLQIYHGINAAVYLVYLAVCYFITGSAFLALGCAIARILIFNTSLNYFRGLSLDYTSQTTTSVIDKITNPIIKKLGYWNYNIALTIVSLILIFI